MHLHTNDGGGIVEAARTDSDQRILLTAAKAGALASLMGENETAAFMQMTKNGGSFGIEKGNHMQGFVGVAEDGESGTIMLTNAENTNSVNLAASKQGGRIILGSDDGTAQASLFATEVGGQLSLSSDIGIERATLGAKEDSGALHLRFGGVTGVIAAASERGGIVMIYDNEGTLAETLPAGGWEDPEDD